jgi:hypothetical protein
VRRIDYFTDCIPHILKANESYIEQNNGLIDEWNENQKMTVLSINGFKTEYLKLNESLNDDIILYQIDQILSSSKGQTDYIKNLEIGLNEVVKPINNICKGHPADLRANSIFHMTQDAIFIFNSYLNNRNTHTKYLETAIKELESTCTKFKEEMSNSYLTTIL